MTTWHCPVCGLDFSFHSELDWHIREAHCLKRTAGLAGQLEREAVLSWAKMRQLASADEHPSVSLLLSTTPAAVMNPADVAELHHLASTASRSFAAELTGQAQKRMELRLEEAVRAAESGPTDHGLAVFVGATETAVVPLPFSPRKRAVVNHIFASRELLEDLQEFPMFRALVLRGPGFWLLEGQGELLSEVLDWQVPNPSLRRARHSAWTTGQRRRAAFAAADRAIGERVAIVGRLPLVVIGRKGLLTRFLRHSPHAASVVGEVLAWGSLQSRSSVAKLAGPQIAAWREKHSAQYLDALAEADRGPGGLGAGLGVGRRPGSECRPPLGRTGLSLTGELSRRRHTVGAFGPPGPRGDIRRRRPGDRTGRAGRRSRRDTKAARRGCGAPHRGSAWTPDGPRRPWHSTRTVRRCSRREPFTKFDQPGWRVNLCKSKEAVRRGRPCVDVAKAAGEGWGGPVQRGANGRGGALRPALTGSPSRRKPILCARRVRTPNLLIP